jgi:type IV pilus assembly protein PilW
MSKPRASRIGTKTLLARGFTLVELMVGVAIGLMSVVVIANVLFNSENQKRSASSGSDAQVNGALGLYEIQRQTQMAGYGLGAEVSALGCNLVAKYGGVDVADFPRALVPLIITQGANGAPDSIRILSSSKTNYSLPTLVTAPGYDPDDVVGEKATRFPVAATLGFASGDLVAAVIDASSDCGVFEVTGAPAAGNIPRADRAAGWNSAKQPAIAYPKGSFLVNLGGLSDLTYSISGNKLMLTRFTAATRSKAAQEIQSNISSLQAMYGKDTNADGIVDTYDTATPTTNAGWGEVVSVRVAIVARSGQYERDEVTAALPLWNVGTTATVAGTSDCGQSKCLTLQVGGGDDWKHYRYKVFDTVIPLRNRLWFATKP